MTTYVIDGYNLIHRAYPETLEPDGCDATMRDVNGLELARRTLQQRLQTFHAQRRRTSRIILVFDGVRGVFGSPAACGELQVMYSRAPETADDVILALCRKLEGRGDLCVVTSDLKDIAGPIRGLACRQMTSEAFAHLLTRASGEQAEDGEKPDAVDADDVDDWLREFGMHDEADTW